MQLLIAGDLVPTDSNIDLFTNADINTLLGEELLSIWNSVDMRIFNLETPLADRETPIVKSGPNLIASTNAVYGLKALNPTLITLANNHILDQGEEGLSSTVDILNKKEIPFVGVGDNLYRASKSYILEIDNIKIGIYACAEHEFTIATENSPGANPFDPLESLDHIQCLKEECDYVIVLYHGGKEHYRFTSPYLQKVCRKIAQKGADLVICQHSHCIGCYEEYEGTKIIYGQGNFIFDRSDSEFWQTSLLIKVKFQQGLFVEYVPIVKENNCVRLASGKTAEDILNQFQQRSDQILQYGFIENQYRKYAKENVEFYLRSLSGMNKWVSRIDRKLLNGLLLKRKYDKKQLLMVKNFIECEAHREMLGKGVSIVHQEESGGK